MPNRGVRAIVYEFERLLGKNGLGAVLKIAELSDWKEIPPVDDLERGVGFNQLAAIYRALEELYGVRSARGLIRQANHTASVRIWSKHGVLAAFHDPDFHQALTWKERISVGCKALSQTFSEISDLDFFITEDDVLPALQLSHCPDCLDLQTEDPACAGMLGFLEGALSIISAEDPFQVREVECMGIGHDRCLFMVSPENKY